MSEDDKPKTELKTTIRFKAKRLDSGEWLESDSIHITYSEDQKTIVDTALYCLGAGFRGWFSVNPATLCRFVGNFGGQDVWEGDVGKTFPVYEGHELIVDAWEFFVRWEESEGAFVGRYFGDEDFFSLSQLGEEFVINGNIHDTKKGEGE